MMSWEKKKGQKSHQYLIGSPARRAVFFTKLVYCGNLCSSQSSALWGWTEFCFMYGIVLKFKRNIIQAKWLRLIERTACRVFFPNNSRCPWSTIVRDATNWRWEVFKEMITLKLWYPQFNAKLPIITLGWKLR